MNINQQSVVRAVTEYILENFECGRWNAHTGPGGLHIQHEWGAKVTIPEPQGCSYWLAMTIHASPAGEVSLLRATIYHKRAAAIKATA